MADFDRSAEFRRNLRQLRDMRAAGWAFESVPLGGDSLSKGNTAEAQQAAADLRLMVAKAQAEKRALQREAASAQSVERRLAARMASGSRASLADRLRSEGYGTRSSPGEIMDGGRSVKLSKGLLSLRGGLKAAGGKGLMVTGVAANLTGAAINGIMDIRDEYKAIKEAGGSDREAKSALLGRVRESVGNTVFQVIGGKSVWTGIMRGAGFSAQGADHAVDRAMTRLFNESGLRRREIQSANVILNEESKTLSAWGKLDASSPQTFRLRNPAEAAAYQNERRRVNQLALDVGIKTENMEKFRQGRVASGN